MRTVNTNSTKNKLPDAILGSVSEFEPVSDCADVNHTHETGGELIVSGCDGAVDFHPGEHALDMVTLPIERPVMPDLTDPA